MDNNFSELDNIIETDILAALGETIPDDDIESIDLPDLDLAIEDESPSTNFEEIEDIDLPTNTVPEEDEDQFGDEIIEIDESEILPLHEIESAIDEQEPIEDQNNSIDLSSSSLASLLSQLLNNKTIEITIKIKD